ncbi:flavin reductase like protein [Breznakia blatticola]|uniref:Flavin reductase like protein n=1 Tax=Breznakia blatticola TaxID=1754012 RepID=A0A4R7Z8J0_9FIRM|nr:flavin reductase [Breznakia blatticola]TDW11057.1 flavin reductase like protein [Breznakia blatticola]
MDHEVNIHEVLQLAGYDIFQGKSALLTAGGKDHFNMMTIGWGTVGIIWNKKVATTYVRRNRFTYNFMLANDFFTISMFDESYEKDLLYLGQTSGKDGNKLANTSLHAYEYKEGIMAYKEADITLVCRKLHVQDLSIVNHEIHNQFYTVEPVHTEIMGEVIAVIDNRSKDKTNK